MIKFKSQLHNFKLPLLIAKRNKGHNEILSYVTVKSSDLNNPEDFIRPLLSIMRASISIDTLQGLAAEICDDFKIQSLSLNVSFLYHLDRTSSQHQPASFELLCSYKVNVVNRVVKSYMGISIPIRVLNVFPLAGKLKFFIENPKGLFFEDLLDYVQKHVGMRLYPKVLFRETDSLSSVIDKGKTAKEYLDILSDVSGLKNLGEGGYVKVITPDVYSSYRMEQFMKWSNDHIQYLTKARKDAISWEEAFIQRTLFEITNELGLDEKLYADIVFIIQESIQNWKEITDTLKETIKDHGKLAHKLIKETAKRRIVQELHLKALEVA